MFGFKCWSSYRLDHITRISILRLTKSGLEQKGLPVFIIGTYLDLDCWKYEKYYYGNELLSKYTVVSKVGLVRFFIFYNLNS